VTSRTAPASRLTIMNTDSAAIRFWKKVDTSGECWEWRASLWGGGYGCFWTGEKRALAHRVSWELAHGEIPSGMCVCHSCDNKLCVRPDHLFLGTQRDNVQDAIKKNRLTGLRNSHAAQRAKTHCLRGHPLSGENLYINPHDGYRHCRTCHRELEAKRYAIRGRTKKERP
jgi:hypothetical protein